MRSNRRRKGTAIARANIKSATPAVIQARDACVLRCRHLGVSARLWSRAHVSSTWPRRNTEVLARIFATHLSRRSAGSSTAIAAFGSMRTPDGVRPRSTARRVRCADRPRGRSAPANGVGTGSGVGAAPLHLSVSTHWISFSAGKRGRFHAKFFHVSRNHSRNHTLLRFLK